MPESVIDQTVIPSFTKQHPEWRAGYFNFGTAEHKGTDYFNCGLVRRPDGLWLITRRAKFRAGMRFGFNDLVAFKLNGETPVSYAPLRLEKRFPDEQWEDPRAIYFNGRTYVSCCDFVWTPTGWSGAHQIMEEVDHLWGHVRRWDPAYGNNGDNLGRNTGHEKNWLWFFHRDQPHMIYRGNPHIVCRFDDQFKFVDETIAPSDLPWKYGEIRGGTPPVLVGGEYWTFFHSSTEWRERSPKRRYHMGAYSFEDKPPFRITRITNAPIISGSQEDRWAEGKPLVVFPSGSEYREGRWFVTLGVNDLASGWMEIPHNDLVELCQKKAKFSLSGWFKDRTKIGNVGVIAYLPPPGVGHTDVFLKNLQEHAPECPVYFISDHDWKGAHIIPDPTKKWSNKDKIASCVFVHALEAAERNGWSEFIYLETDCRVSNSWSNGGWDKAMIKAFRSGQSDSIAGGNMAIFGYEKGDSDFKQTANALVKKHGYQRAGEVCDKVKILFQGLRTDKTIAFVNGAPAIYSTADVRKILGTGTVDQIVDRMKNSDLSIGEICGDDSSAAATLRRYIHIPQVMATAGEVMYPFRLRKTALENGDCIAVHPVKNRWRPPPPDGAAFYHCGDLGDIVYGLKAIQLYGRGHLVLGSAFHAKFPPRSPMKQEVFSLFEPLLIQQSYLDGVQYCEDPANWTYDLNEFRTYWNNRQALGLNLNTLCEAHCYTVGVEPLFNCEPWLRATQKPISRIIVNRSPRHREDNFPWKELIAKHNKEMVFVGVADEWRDFCNLFGKVSLYQPLDFADMAAVINSSEWFVGNQSFPLSLAIGLGKPVLIEEWHHSPDCTFNRDNLYTQHTMKGLEL